MQFPASRIFLIAALGGTLAIWMGGCPTTNHDPVANAGSDQTVTAGAAVVLNGAASTDADNNTLTFAWTQTSGTAVTLTNANLSVATFTAPATTGTLVFSLTVSDGHGGTDTATVNITVQAGGSTNHNPTASAGTDQNVAGGATVNLAGGGTDQDGDALTYAWTQTTGTTVTLANAGTANASFAAPQVSGTLTFQLTANDGKGGTGTDTITITVTATPILYIANFTGNNVIAYENPATVNGNIAPLINLSGLQTQLLSPTDIVIDRNGALIACNFAAAPASLSAYDNAAAANGNLAPNRLVQGAATGLSGPVSLAINSANDLLFVANINAPDHIAVFANASSTALNGNLAPIRTIQSVALNDPYGVNFDASDNLYVANHGAGNVLVFANASTLNGAALTPTRTLTNAVFLGAWDVFIDNQDRLYVVAQTNKVYIFNHASTLNGAVSPDVTLTVTAAFAMTAIAVDDNNTGYLVDNVTQSVFSYDNIATRNGALAPDRTISGSNTQINGPVRVFLQKR